MSATTTATMARVASRPLVDIQQVSTRLQLDQFIRLPWQIYRNDPVWVAPLLLERKEFLDRRRHPFYLHGSAVQYLAIRDGQVVGRIQASDDPRYNEQHGSNVGCFGMFECIDDAGVAHALLEAAERWLAARGRTAMMGPIDYSTNYACGLLVEGFDKPPRFMMGHNPSYYLGLLESFGLAKAKDLYSWWFGGPCDLPIRWQKRAERLVRRGIVVRPLVRGQLEAEVMRCKNIYNEAWERHWGFVKMTDAEFHYYGKLLAQVAVPELIFVAEVDGRPVGFSITLPDCNEALRPLDGRLTRWGLPLGWLRLRKGLKQIRTGRLITLGILEPYRRRGIVELLILRTLCCAYGELGYKDADLGWTLEDNHAINHTIEKVGGVRYKTYRIYEKMLD